MSQLTLDTNLPTISSLDGFITDAGMLELSAAIEDSVNTAGDAIGNISGLGDYQYDERKFINTIASTIGTELNDPALPFNIEMTNVTHSIVLGGDTEAYLPLIPVGTPTINGFDSNGDPIAYTFIQNTNFFIDGRKIRFSNPPHAFQITYTGTYPSSEYISEAGYRPNIIPNPLLGLDFVRPTLTNISGKIHVTVPSANALQIDSNNDIADKYDTSLSLYLQQFIDGSATTACPSAYISAYRLNTETDKFYKIDCENIYIVSVSEFALETNETIDLDNDVIIISISNMTIKELLYFAIREIQAHKHDGNDISSVLNHSDLIGLIPAENTEGPGIVYGKSNIRNNDHPQYIHREGYRYGSLEIDDDNTYNNAMLGDLFIASTDSDALFNNTLANSFSLIFGTTDTPGHTIIRKAVPLNPDEDVLQISTTKNGILISSDHTTTGMYAVGVETDGGEIHKIGNKTDDNDLLVNSNSGKTSFAHYDVGNAEYIYEDVQIDTAIAEKIDLGLTSIENVATGIKISSTDPADIMQLFVPTSINISGLGNGISFDSGIDNYSKMYVSKDDGTTPTLLDHKTVIEAGTDGVWFIKHPIGVVTSIAAQDRSDLYVGKLDSSSISLFKATDTEKNGIRFGNDHRMYMTPTGDYANGTLVVEANAFVSFVKPSINIEIDNPIYTDVKAGTFIAATGFSGPVISASAVIDSLIINDSLTSVSGSVCTFNGNVSFNEAIQFNDDVSIGVLTVANVGNFTQQLNAVSANIDILTTEVTALLKGQVVISEHSSNPSSLTVNVVSDFNNEVNFKDKVTITNELNVTSSSIFNTITANSVTSTAGSFTTLSADNLNIDNINCQRVSAGLSIETQGTLKAYGETRLGFDGSDTIIHGNLSMVTGNQLDISSCTAINLEMPTYTYDFDSYPPDAINPLNAKDAVNREYVINAIMSAGTLRMLKSTYPIGTIYQNLYNQNNPGSINGPFGTDYFGEWTACGEGMVLIGKGEHTDANLESRTYNTIGVTGGEYSHANTGSENGPHTHLSSIYWAGGGYNSGTHHFPSDYSADPGYTSHLTSESGEGDPHNNVQPYIVVARWVRLAW